MTDEEKRMLHEMENEQDTGELYSLEALIESYSDTDDVEAWENLLPPEYRYEVPIEMKTDSQKAEVIAKALEGALQDMPESIEETGAPEETNTESAAIPVVASANEPDLSEVNSALRIRSERKKQRKNKVEGMPPDQIESDSIDADDPQSAGTAATSDINSAEEMPNTSHTADGGPRADNTLVPDDSSKAAHSSKSSVSDSADISEQSKQAVKETGEKKTQKSTRQPKKGGSENIDDSDAGSLSRSILAVIELVRSRQNHALPPAGTSIKKRRDQLQGELKISRVMLPFQIILLILMFLSLFGRRFSWMSLGVLNGENGIIINLVLLVLSVLLAAYPLLEMTRSIMLFRLTYECFLLLATVLNAADTIITQNSMHMLPLLGIGWCLAGLSRRMRVRGDYYGLQTILAGTQRNAVRVSDGVYNEESCIGKRDAGTAGFVRSQSRMTAWDAAWVIYAPILLLIAVVVCAYISARMSISYLTCISRVLAYSVPVGLSVCCVRPYELNAWLSQKQSALAGWYGTKLLSGRKYMFLYDQDLFPKGMILHKGIKIYGNQTAKLLVSYAASLIVRAKNGLEEPFTQMCTEMQCDICAVNNFRVQNGGMDGNIHNVKVALGTYQFMQLMGRAIPNGAPRGGIFISINNQIAGVFGVKYSVKNSASRAMFKITGNPGLSCLIATRNFSIDPAFIHRYFKIPVETVTCPKEEQRWALSQPQRFRKGYTAGFVFRSGVFSYSNLVVNARRIHLSGTLLTVISLILSFLCFVISCRTLLGAADGISAATLGLWQLIAIIIIEAAARFCCRR